MGKSKNPKTGTALKLLADPDALRKKALPYLFLSPVFVMIIGFLLYPFCNVFYYSFQNFNPTMPFYNGFVGFDNFIKIFTADPLFYRSLLVSAIWVFGQVVLQLLIGLVTALVLNHPFRGRGLVRGVMFTPWAISGVIVAIMWSMIYNEHFGLLNDLLLRFGLVRHKIAWVSNTNTALFAAMLAELWRGVPFFAISLLSALQLIPGELYESCAIDGGGRIVAFFHITLAYLKETIILTTLLRAVWEFKSVDIIYNLTAGGPINSTTTLSMYMADQAIKLNNFGYGSAISVISFGCLMIFAVFYLKLGNFGGEK
jgi:multiple sugar transport system permease protein